MLLHCGSERGCGCVKRAGQLNAPAAQNNIRKGRAEESHRRNFRSGMRSPSACSFLAYLYLCTMKLAKAKQTAHLQGGLFITITGDLLISHAPTRAVPSAQRGLTSVFGMGTGVTLTVYSPANLLAAIFSLMAAKTWVGAWQVVSPAVGAEKTGWLERYIQKTGAILLSYCAN